MTRSLYSLLLLNVTLILLHHRYFILCFPVEDTADKRTPNNHASVGSKYPFDSHKLSAWNHISVNFPNLSAGERSSRLKKATFDDNLRQESLRTSSYKNLSKVQSEEDIWLYEHLFYGMKDGLILESGALDGMRFSTSYMFEKFANWSAVHVEVDPRNYHNLVHNRPEAINVHAALCSSPQKLHFLYKPHESHSPIGGIYEFMSSNFVEHWHPKLHADPSLIDQYPVINCLRAADLFDMLGINHIDVWILDVEGAEESVLLGTDFDAVRIEAVAMECDGREKEKNNRKTAILERNNFKCSWHLRSCMCVQKDYIARNV